MMFTSGSFPEDVAPRKAEYELPFLGSYFIIESLENRPGNGLAE